MLFVVQKVSSTSRTALPEGRDAERLAALLDDQVILNRAPTLVFPYPYPNASDTPKNANLNA